ncbi:unnamed protein product, partial [Allacma fusca]
GNMNYLRNFFPLKLAMVTLIALYLILAISSSSASYYGPRYGKRESDLSRYQARSIGQRNNRGARFYPGSRYGGKRSYWQPTSFMPSDADIGSVDSLNVPNVPFDCILIPNLGVRCSRPEAVSDWNNDDEISAGNGGSAASTSGGSSSASADQP